MLTTDMYMERRSQERKVRSLAQWSRASEEVLGKRRGVRMGRREAGGLLEGSQ